MFTVDEIRNVRFSRAIRGYKDDEVDVFLDKVESDYLGFERKIKEQEEKIDALNNELSELKNSQSSIQNVLISAQNLAEKIVKEAKEKSEAIIKSAEENITSITNREKELSAAFKDKAQEQKAALQKELDEKVKSAEEKAAKIIAAAEEKRRQEQALFDRIKLEIANFKVEITEKYKEHLSNLAKLPDSIPSEQTLTSDDGDDGKEDGNDIYSNTDKEKRDGTGEED